MSILNGNGQTEFPSLLGDDTFYQEFENLNVINQFSIQSLGLTNAEFATLEGIHTYETIQEQIDNFSNITNGKGYWGSFFSTLDQTAVSTNTAYNVTLNNADTNNNQIVLSNQIGTTGNYQSMRILEGAVYNIQFSLQLTSTNANTSSIKIWLRKNGVDITASAGVQSISTNNGNEIICYNIITTLATADDIYLYWQTTDTSMYIKNIPATTTPYVSPASPSVIVTFQQVQYYQDNTAAVTALQAQVNTLSDNVNTFETDTINRFTTDEADFTDLSGNYYAFKTATNSSISSLTTTTNNNSDSIGTINNDINAINTKLDSDGNLLDSLSKEVDDLKKQVQVDTNNITTLNTTTTTNATAISVVAGIVTAQGTEIDGLITASSAQSTAIGELETAVTNLETNQDTITSQVQNIEWEFTTEGVTNFTGEIGCGSLSVDEITMTTTLSGTGKINLSSTAGANSIYSPSTTIASVTGTGGGVYLGGLADSVYINGFLFQSFFQQFSIPTP